VVSVEAEEDTIDDSASEVSATTDDLSNKCSVVTLVPSTRVPFGAADRSSSERWVERLVECLIVDSIVA
jgi:hypothetical protein